MRTRSVGLNVRVSPTEKHRIQTAAGRRAPTLSEYPRQRALGDEPRVPPRLADQYRRCREGLLDSLLRKGDASGDH